MGSDELLVQKFGKKVAAGTVLFKDGEAGQQMFVIHSGKIRITKKIGDVEKTLAILPAGEFFGEMAILNDEPRTATAVVEEDSQLLVIDPKTFEAMIRGNSEISLRMIKKLAQRLKQADEQIESLMIKDNNTKIISILAKMAENEGEETAGGIKIKLTVKDLAMKTGLAEPKVTEILNKVIAARILTVEENGMTVSDSGKLRKFLDFLTLKEQFGEA
ncbi:MAG: Crp/Fnr family transcriptional regulator [bacterium]|nr:Crp/Fnr family transcriptional regulator [bacterium]